MTVADNVGFGLARVRRGPQGGLSLARRSDDITLADIIWAVDAPVVVARQSRDPNHSAESEVLRRLWASAHDSVFAVFSQVLLAHVRTTVPPATTEPGAG